MVRRRWAAGIAVAVLVIIVLLISGCLKSEKQQSLKDYNRHVGEIAQEYDTVVATPLFTTLTGASSKPALNVETQVNQLLLESQKLNARAQALSVPSEMTGAQRAFLLALGLRVEGITKIAAQLPAALGGQGKQVGPKIAGAMQTFLASDVIYSQRVAPLIQQELSANSISEPTSGGRFLPNLGWLETNTLLGRLTGQSGSAASESTGVAPGHHGTVLKGVSVGSTQLEAEPALNHIGGGGNVTFTVSVEDDGEFTEPGVTVDVAVTAAGKTITKSGVISQTEPGKTSTVEIAVPGIPLEAAANVAVSVQPVPGETNHEGTKSTYLAIFG
jgi:hypothetical protein